MLSLLYSLLVACLSEDEHENRSTTIRRQSSFANEKKNRYENHQFEAIKDLCSLCADNLKQFETLFGSLALFVDFNRNRNRNLSGMASVSGIIVLPYTNRTLNRICTAHTHCVRKFHGLIQSASEHCLLSFVPRCGCVYYGDSNVCFDLSVFVCSFCLFLFRGLIPSNSFHLVFFLAF